MDFHNTTSLLLTTCFLFPRNGWASCQHKWRKLWNSSCMNVYQQGKRGKLTLHSTHHRYTSVTLEMYYPIIPKKNFLRARYFFDGNVKKVKCARCFMISFKLNVIGIYRTCFFISHNIIILYFCPLRSKIFRKILRWAPLWRCWNGTHFPVVSCEGGHLIKSHLLILFIHYLFMLWNLTTWVNRFFLDVIVQVKTHYA